MYIFLLYYFEMTMHKNVLWIARKLKIEVISLVALYSSSILIVYITQIDTVMLTIICNNMYCFKKNIGDLVYFGLIEHYTIQTI